MTMLRQYGGRDVMSLEHKNVFQREKLVKQYLQDEYRKINYRIVKPKAAQAEGEAEEKEIPEAG